MASTDTTPVPGSSSQSTALLAVGLGIFAAFLVVVGLLGAGRVWVTETEVSYTQVETLVDGNTVNTWVATGDVAAGAATGITSSWVTVSELPSNLAAADRPSNAVFS